MVSVNKAFQKQIHCGTLKAWLLARYSVGLGTNPECDLKGNPIEADCLLRVFLQNPLSEMIPARIFYGNHTPVRPKAQVSLREHILNPPILQMRKVRPRAKEMHLAFPVGKKQRLQKQPEEHSHIIHTSIFMTHGDGGKWEWPTLGDWPPSPFSFQLASLAPGDQYTLITAKLEPSHPSVFVCFFSRFSHSSSLGFAGSSYNCSIEDSGGFCNSPFLSCSFLLLFFVFNLLNG